VYLLSTANATNADRDCTNSSKEMIWLPLFVNLEDVDRLLEEAQDVLLAGHGLDAVVGNLVYYTTILV
jgi:hypothetical protein